MSQCKLCRAIEEIRRVEFNYQGTRISVDPYIVYEDVDTGEILLGGIQAGHTSAFTTFPVDSITDVTLKVRFKPIVIDSGAPRYKKTIRLVEV